MRLLECRIPRNHDLYLLGDSHEGNSAQYERGLRNTIAEILGNDRAFFTYLGDACETTTIDSKYYDPSNLKKDPETGMLPTVPYVQARTVAEQFSPIASKCVAWLDGNHDRRAMKYLHLSHAILERMNLLDAYGGYTCKLSVKDLEGKLMYKVFLFHGRTMAQSRAGSEKQKRANQEASLQRMLAPLAGDCVIMACGHTHRLLVSKPVRRLYITDDGRDIKQHRIQHVQAGKYIDPENRFYVNTGSFLRTQVVGLDTYSEIAAYAPVDLGFAVAHTEGGIIRDVEERPI